MSDKIQPRHLARKAMLYVRQSSAFQLAHNPESQKLQYAMQSRLRDLGFTEIEERIAQHSGARDPDPAPTLGEFTALAERLETLWEHPDTDARLKKRILRSLIHEIIVDVDPTASEIVLW